MALFQGSGVAIVTPFNPDFTINFDALGELIEFHIANHTDAIIICGTTGEAATLTDEEQIECVRYTVEKAAGRIPVIAGAGSNHTDHCISLALGCQNAGADGLLLVTPYYNKTTQKGLIAHYSAVANAVDIPIILYHIPGRTGVTIQPETFRELVKLPHVVGIKEACGNISAIAKTAHLCPGIDLYSGDDDQILPIMSLGGIGVISVFANICPQQCHDLCMAYLEGDTARATQMQLDALPLMNALFNEVNPIPVKAALRLMGFNVGHCKLPLVDPEPQHLEELRQAMIDYGVLPR